MADSTPAAVVFDLWNTLVPLPDELKRRAFEVTASIFGRDPEQLRQLWATTRAQRETTHLESYLTALCAMHGLGGPAQVRAVMQARARIHGRAFMQPLGEAVSVLDGLRADGLSLAVVSNCTSDVPAMLAASSLGGRCDVMVFSSRVGVMKPDPTIYLHAASRLGVPPYRCVYVGDGSDDELHGATEAGMTAVLLNSPDAPSFGGPRVERLAYVRQFVALGVAP
jgi:putative hydrolase of the HAD superfamily